MLKRTYTLITILLLVVFSLFVFYQNALTALLRFPENTQISHEITVSELFGNGSDGDLIVGSGQTAQFCETLGACTPVTQSANAGQNSLQVGTSGWYYPGDEIMIIQMQGIGTGLFEFATVLFSESNVLTLEDYLTNAYSVDSQSQAQVLLVPQYHNVTIESGGIMTSRSWDWEGGGTGGIIVFRASGTVSIEVEGQIDTSGLGYQGGSYIAAPVSCDFAGHAGEGITGNRDIQMITNNGNGGGGGWECNFNGGAGGGHATAGAPGYGNISQGGSIVGTEIMSNTLFLGGGGGSAAPGGTGGMEGGGAGGAGGGIIFIAAKNFYASGELRSNGNNGQGGAQIFGGGGGAAGAIKIIAENVEIGTELLFALGGQGGGPNRPGGGGGDGRIRIEYCDTLVGTTNPPASVEQISCPVPDLTPTIIPSHTLTITPVITLTPSPSPTPAGVLLPLITNNFSTFFEGPNEQEPNNASADANGPLRSNQAYFGVPVDERDFFSFVTQVQGQILVDLTNHPLSGLGGAQVQLFYESVTTGAVALDVSPPYQINYSGVAGTYYILVFTDISKCGECNLPYTIVVTYP